MEAIQDTIAGFQAAPLWAQIGMVFFAVTAVVMFAEPTVRNRRARRQFDTLARGVGASPPEGRGWPVMFRTTTAGRAFEVRHDLRSRSKGGSYRGPTGHLLITAMQLTSDKWSMHQVDIRTLDKMSAWLLKNKHSTGDQEFDARFLVVEDGLPVRQAWLDDEVRGEVQRFFSAAPIPGVIWIRERELQFIMESPWTRVDGPALRSLLEHQAALASVLDRSAARRV
jgi:hypothetical protein